MWRLTSPVSRLLFRSSRASHVHNSRRTLGFAVTGNLSEFKGAVPPVGAWAEVDHVFSQEAVNSFAAICGDDNPLHTDPEWAKSSMFGGTIVHGILVSSLFSNLFGRSLPGSIYVSQTLQFRRPVHVGARVTARVEIKEVKPHRTKGHILTCDTTVRIVAENSHDQDGNDMTARCIKGEGHVLVPKKD